MKIFKLKTLFSITLLCIMHCLLHATTTASADKQNNNFSNEVVCKSATIRSIKDFNALENCTVVAGYVRIVQMVFNADVLTRVIASNIEEISEYLLVYRVEGLDSLERLFPKLILIRGVELLYDQYALIVLENRDLQNIGLVSLLRVLKGSIRVESNPDLCFSHTINWVSILGNNTKQYNYVIKNNKPPNQCPLCYTYQDELTSIEVHRHKKCWSLQKFQRTTLDYIGDEKCYGEEGKSNCLTSCSDNNCRHCTNYVSDKGCVNNCFLIKQRLAFKRQCVLDCSLWGLVQFGMECVEKCPRHYQEVKKYNKIVCVLNCMGNFVINKIEDLEGFDECTTLEGSLTIDLNEINKPIIVHLEHAFRQLNEITGYLKIIKSPQIISLHFFKNLHTIKGLELIDDMYSLYVVDNQHLEELWLQNVAIIHGCVYFHLNPRLCFNKITDLKDNLKECTQITVKEASRNSNGERAVCGEEVRAINASITDFNSTSALVVVDSMEYEDFVILIGYIYYYKEAPYRNVTRFDARHGCGQDSWFTDVLLTQRRRHILKDLKPGTQYAYFVKSMNMMDYPYQAEYVSEIQYFQTKPAKPGPIAKIYTHSLSTEEIEIHWWPPRQTNGIIEKYILQYNITNETIHTTPADLLKEELCQCPKLDTETHMHSPHPEDYYIKEKWLYHDALNNFQFRKRPETRKVTLNESETIRIDEIFKKFEEDTLRKQDEGEETYVINHPNPVCNQSHPNAQDQAKNKCTPLERFETAIEIPGQSHSYILKNLEPAKTYRISLRACVKDLANGCGDEIVTLAETVSKSLETILENLTFFKY